MRPRWVVGIPWWLALCVWLMWFSFTILLTFAALLIIIGGAIIYVVGALLEPRWPEVGRGWKQTGGGLVRITARWSDAINGHRNHP